MRSVLFASDLGMTVSVGLETALVFCNFKEIIFKILIASCN